MSVYISGAAAAGGAQGGVQGRVRRPGCQQAELLLQSSPPSALPCLPTHPPTQPTPRPTAAAVACQAKFIFLFKRPGKVVLLSRRGDLIVRPAAIEFSAHQCVLGRGAGEGLRRRAEKEGDEVGWSVRGAWEDHKRPV